MNVYDFDKTIYNGDSSVDFYLYSVKRDPALVRFAFRQAWGFLLYLSGRIDKTHLKSYFFSFLRGIDTKRYIADFWDKNASKIAKWYLEKQRDDDVIISASPEFLLEPICEKIGIKNLIASEMDPDTGAFNGANCKGEEKVKRFGERFGGCSIDEFYSDSLSDLPLARFSARAFIVKSGNVCEWNIDD